MKRLFERYPVGLVMLLALSCLAPVLVLRDFSPANELRYLSIADEALASGHWLSFSNHGVPYADKPPLYFWLVMLCRLLLGKHSMPVLSLLSLLPAFGVVAVMDRWAFRKESPLTRAAAAMLLLTTGLFLGRGIPLPEFPERVFLALAAGAAVGGGPGCICGLGTSPADAVVCLIDLAHFSSGSLIARVEVGVIFLRQFAIRSGDLFLTGAPGDAEDLIGISHWELHPSFLS